MRFRPLVLATLMLLPLAAARSADAPDVPLPLDLTERTGRQLLQFDVVVRGPEEIATALAAGDFEIILDGRPVTEFTLDSLCPPSPLAGDDGRAGTPPPSTPVSYVLYFDQMQLTTEGRRRSLELARELVNELVVHGSRGMVVSSGQRLRFFTGLTADRDELLGALDRLANDLEQIDTFAEYEGQRVAELFELHTGVDAATGLASGIRRVADQAAGGIEARSMGGGAGSSGGIGLRRGIGPPRTATPDPAALGRASSLRGAADDAASALRGSAGAKVVSLARELQREERWHTDRALARFAAVLARLAGEQPPKAVVYFADTMRSQPGDHYLDLIEGSGQATAVSFRGPSPVFDRVVDAAQAHGVRLYTVEARGLASFSTLAASGWQTRGVTSLGRLDGRFHDAHDGLTALALETGGRAFLNGVRGERMARAIRDDLGCVYLVSIDTGSLRRDHRLPLRVRVRKPVEIRTRTSLISSSDSARLLTRIGEAFIDPDVEEGSLLRARMLPTSYADGRYTGLIQVTLPASGPGRATWDVGVSVLAQGTVKEAVSGRITLGSQRAVLVFESPISVAPGPYEIVAVAHDPVADRVLSAHGEGRWPDPEREQVTIGPVELLQTVAGVFTREGRLRRRGSLALNAEDAVQARLPSAFTTVVCREPPSKTTLVVERTLTGETATRFDPPLRIEAGDEPCALVQDAVRGGTLGAGAFSYDVRVRVEGTDEPLTVAGREFVVE